MLEGVKSVLKRLNVYYRLKYSALFRLYERVFKPQIIAQHNKEVRLYKAFLESPALIFDIGAYDGHKTAAFAEISLKVISCEPDPDSFAILSTRFRNCKNKVHLLNCAVYNKEAEVVLQRNSKGSAFNTLNPDWSNILQRDQGKRWGEKIEFDESISVVVKTTTLDKLIEQFGLPDFIKIDVEGSELQVMNGLSKKIGAVSFECLLPEFKPQLLEILGRLLSLDSGYRFNVIYNEELVLPKPVSHEQILKWIEATTFQAFDMLAILEDNSVNRQRPG